MYNQDSPPEYLVIIEYLEGLCIYFLRVLFLAMKKELARFTTSWSILFVARLFILL